MHEKDNPLGICQRIFNLFLNTLIARGLKHITLGHVATEVPLVDTLTRNREDSPGEQQSMSIANQNVVEKVDHEARKRSKYDSGYDIQVHFKHDEEGLEHWTSIDKPVSSAHKAQTGNQPLLKKKEESRATELAGNKELPLVQAKADATAQGKGSQEPAAQVMMEPNLTTWIGGRDSKKAASIKDQAAEGDWAKEKGKRMASGKLTLAIVPEELNVRHPRHLFSVASNINEKSDEFIKSRKEAMRRNFSLEPKRP